MSKVKVLLGRMTFLENPNKTIIHSIGDIIEVESNIADMVAEAIIGIVYDSYLIPSQYKGIIEYESEDVMPLSNVYKAKEALEENGYYVDNLWTVDDVKSKFDCTDKEAQKVLNNALTNEATMEQIWLAIDYAAESYKLKPIED